jgi:hypothetical protein
MYAHPIKCTCVRMYACISTPGADICKLLRILTTWQLSIILNKKYWTKITISKLLKITNSNDKSIYIKRVPLHRRCQKVKMCLTCSLQLFEVQFQRTEKNRMASNHRNLTSRRRKYKCKRTNPWIPRQVHNGVTISCQTRPFATNFFSIA